MKWLKLVRYDKRSIDVNFDLVVNFTETEVTSGLNKIDGLTEITFSYTAKGGYNSGSASVTVLHRPEQIREALKRIDDYIEVPIYNEEYDLSRSKYNIRSNDITKKQSL